MELRQLEYFIEVSRLKNFTQAAEQLHVTQPSVTISLNKLEDELGVKLLDRNTKRVRLTCKGEVFYQRMLGVFTEMQDAVNEVRKNEDSNVSIGLPPMIGATFFPQIFSQFHKYFPNINFNVVEKGSAYTLEMLEKGELELGFIILPKSSETLEMIPLIDAKIVACVPTGHKFVQRRFINWDDLSNELFIMLSDEFVHKKIIYEGFNDRGIVPNTIFSSNKIETVKNMVASGLGISLLMDKYVEDDKEIKGIPLIPEIPLKIGLAWRKERKISKSSMSFIEFSSDFYTGSLM